TCRLWSMNNPYKLNSLSTFPGELHVLFVSEVHRPGQGFHHLGRRAGWLRVAIDEPVERAAVHELEGEIRKPLVLADLVDLHDVGVLQWGEGAGLLAEAGELLRAGVGPGQDHLQRAQPIQPYLPGLVDEAHPAATQLPQDLVTGDGRQFTPALRRICP